MLRWRFPALAAGLLALATGCSGSKDGSFATVSGVVSVDGTPVDGAKVTLYSTAEVDGKPGASYSSLTDSSGKYLIATTGKDPGIPPGVYKVTVTKFDGKFAAGAEGMDAGQTDAMVSDTGGGAKGGPTNLLPKEYATVATSKLSATLDVGKNEGVNFALKKK
ncbi:carboxypeptidase-like regulatory domain-containing protein [Urbifossiella limnaea]|uniref:Carboxypeptidase regulatory-like domain-containing protein n=1 Tax=Urbifossiella limnaea TaxID=2528023 RepID=A0A517Y0J0_9BACT|nr:carboxypeptidase-like regulatory domain-containing protein [Urbifossiella limnaea]QDU23277.1 hypothetical protein ETAA1_52710 [Urbifossiella limnaea]